MTEAPVAPQKPHTWERPTGPADDPWAWLRDREDPDTIAYLEAENAYAAAFFEPRQDLVEELFTEIKSRVQETDESVPVRHGPWWYVSRTIEGESYPVFCRGRTFEEATADVILDCNAEARGHEFFDVHAVETSPDHTLLAWSSDTDGGERYTVRVRELATGEELPDELTGTSSWGGLAWSGDGRWLFYARPDEQMRPHQIWRHELGTPVSADVLVLEEPDERFSLHVSATRSERWVVFVAGSKTTSEVHVLPAGEPTAPPGLVRARQQDVEYSVDDWGDRFVVLTNLDAPDFRVMTAPHDAPGDWTELLPHVPGRRYTAAEPFAGHLAVHEWSDAQPRLRVHFRDGREEALDFGAEPHDVELGANPEWDSTALRLAYQSLTTPASVYDHDVATGERVLRKRTPTPNVDLDSYVSSRSWATATDGSAVPVDVVRHVDTPLDGTAPTVVYGYGSYEASFPPWFSVARLSLLDRGWVWVLVHPRGGGELGRRWYLDGKLLNKRNTFTDTLAAVEHLVATRVADPQRIVIRGGSAGGLLVGACVNLRPDLFAGAVAEVPFVDIVTTMSDPTLPLTAGEWEEWGDPRGALRVVHAELLAVRQHRRGRPPRDVRDGRAQRPAGELPRAGQVGGPPAVDAAPGAPARSSCAPRWAPATAAPAVATTRGATRRGPSPSSSPPSESSTLRARRHEVSLWHNSCGNASVEGDGEALAGGEHLDAQLAAARGGAGGQAVEGVVVVRRVVVEQRQSLGADLAGQPDGVLDRAVAPVALLGELGRRVLGVVDQQVDALAQPPHRLGDLRAAVRLLVVADVGHAGRPVGDPIAQRLADVRDLRRLDLVAADAETGLRRPDVDVAGEAVEADREQWRLDRVGEHLGGPASVLLVRRVHDELGFLVEQRAEERQPLHVVPVEVADQARPLERFGLRAAQAEVAQTGAHVEQQRILALHTHRDARRVPAVTGDVLAVARRRTAHAVKRDQHAGIRPPWTKLTKAMRMMPGV